MKKFLVALFVLAVNICAGAQSDDGFDYVFLNNGNVVKGVIESETDNKSVSIRSVNGELYVYNAIEVRKVVKGKSPKLPKANSTAAYVDHETKESGFWIATELQGGYSLRFNKDNVGFGELDVTLGYRFNEYVKIGVGLGSRYYLDNEDVRSSSIEWSFPIYANVRGNFMPSLYRTVVPYYSMELGGAIRDGFMFRPTVGIRIGHPRRAFLVGVSYMLQSMKCHEIIDDRIMEDRKGISFITLRIGYEF